MLKKITLADQAYDRLLRRIVSGSLASGTRLAEEELSAKLGISRTPVRAALLRLQQEGLLETLPGRGCQVKSFEPDAVRELFECRAILEENALDLAFAALPREELLKLRLLLTQPGSGDNQKKASLEADERLHALVAQCCPNRPLADILGQLTRQTAAWRNYRTLAADAEYAKATNERLEIIDAILSGRRAAARALLRTHIERGGNLGAAPSGKGQS